MKIKLILLMVSVASICLAQPKKDTTLKTFSSKWKAESLGLNGFREKHYDSISVNYKTRIGKGINITGFTQAQVIALLGPTSSGRHFEDDGLLMTYLVKRKKNNPAPEMELIIYFDKNELVCALARSLQSVSKTSEFKHLKNVEQ